MCNEHVNKKHTEFAALDSQNSLCLRISSDTRGASWRDSPLLERRSHQAYQHRCVLAHPALRASSQYTAARE